MIGGKVHRYFKTKLGEHFIERFYGFNYPFQIRYQTKVNDDFEVTHIAVDLWLDMEKLNKLCEGVTEITQKEYDDFNEVYEYAIATIVDGHNPIRID